MRWLPIRSRQPKGGRPGSKRAPGELEAEISRLRQQLAELQGQQASSLEFGEEPLRHGQRMESLGHLAAGIAHDFNNLLTGIRGGAELVLLNLPSGSSDRRLLESLVEATVRATALTRQLQTYAGKGKIDSRPTNLNTMLAGMADLLRVSIGNRFTLKYDFAHEAPIAQADEAQLGQVVVNLLLNAAEAYETESGAILVRTGRLEPQPVEEPSSEGLPPDSSAVLVFLEVLDHGKGLPPTVRERMFDPFFSTKRVGRGLGLAVVHGIVRKHGGSLQVSSPTDGGTAVRVILPAAEGEPVEQARDLQSALPPDLGTILVIEDDHQVRNFVEILLENFNATVLTASGGREGTEQLRKHMSEVDIVLVDYAMPDLDGTQLLRELRNLSPHLPILVMSGLALEEKLQHQFLADSARSGYIQKPFSPTQLVEALLRLKSSPSEGTS